MPDRRYRYTKRRWRVLVRVLDVVGALAMALWRMVRPANRLEHPRRILLVQLDHLGDAVLTTPILPRLRAAYPDSRIDVLASASNRAVFESDPNINQVHLAARNWFERRSAGWAMASALLRHAGILRRERYDLGIDVRGDVLTVFLLALAGIPRRLGWAMGGGGFLLTDVASWVPGRHEVESRLALIGTLGIDTDGPARVSVHVEESDRARVASLLIEAWPGRASRHVLKKVVAGRHDLEPDVLRDRSGSTSPDPERLHAGRFGEPAPLLAIHLGAGTQAKRWPTRHWQALVARFLDDGWRVIVIGGEDDAEQDGPPLRAHPALRDWSGRLMVAETTALLERADLFLGADSGPAHLAASAGVPSVVLFSGTNNPRQWRPYSRRSLVLRHTVPCRPCHRKVCPLADHPCLSGLSPAFVYRASKRWWARLHRQESPHAPL